jgi:hypothetical protein
LTAIDVECVRRARPVPGALRPAARIVAVAGLLLLALVPAVTAPARAGEIVVVGNPGLPVDTISAEDLRRIYIGEEAFLQGVRLLPIDYNGEGPLATAFLAAVVNMDPGHFHAWWVRQVFHGDALPPRTVDTVDQALQLIASEPGAIGYVPAERLAGVESVKRLLSLPVP